MRCWLMLRFWAFFVALGSLLWGLGLTFALNLDTHGAFLWTVIGAASLASGFIAGRRGLALADLTGGAALTTATALLGAFLAGEDVGISSAVIRHLLVLPAVIILLGTFGRSIGFLVGSGGGASARSGYASWVGLRLLLTKGSPALSTVTWLSLLGVTLGVWLVIVSIGVLSGFERDLEDKIVGAYGHLSVEPKPGAALPYPPPWLDQLSSTHGLTAVTPLIEGEVAVASRSNYGGALLYGVDATAPSVLAVLGRITQGSLAALTSVEPPPEQPLGNFAAPAAVLGIAVGKEMAKSLGVTVGDTVRIISPTQEVLTPLGVAPKSRALRVAAIFESKMFEYDARYAYVSMEVARAFVGLAPNDVSAIRARTKDAGDASRTAALLRAEPAITIAGLRVVDWQEHNQSLFAALKLERVVAFVVLIFIILVAAFSIANTLSMSVIERRRTIAILKTMGSSDTSVMKVFMTQAVVIGCIGTGIGVALALVSEWALGTFGFGIPGDVYYIDALPIRIEGFDVVLVVAASLVIIWNFAVFPALRGARLLVVDGLRS